MKNIEFRSISQPLELWQIFLEECSGHILAFKGFTVDENKIFSIEDTRKLSHRLHRVKGSLGFIGFTAMAAKVKHCEEVLNAETPELFTTLKDILNELVDLHSELLNLIEK